MINKKFLISGMLSIVLASNLFAAKVTALKSTIAEETFQMLIVNAVLKKMGHDISSTNEVNYDIAYQTIANNANSDEVFFLAGSWDPLHNSKLKAVGGEEKVVKFSNFI